ncbi:MAG: glycoside hydrolase family 1 protein, partial [Solirubrobacteraceae bacterium]|nr:glycoside hydrolase family 1 protein [Solirubrobacteraceae bacterium]
MISAWRSFSPSRLAVVVAVAAAFAALPAVSVAQQPAGGSMPKGFLWGTAISGFQSEMGRGRDTDPTSDWWAWVHDSGNIASNTVSGEMPENGPGFWSKYAADIKLARGGLGANLFRMGLEWSRLFPKQPTNLPAGAATSAEMLRTLDRQADPKAVSRYRAILKAIRASKMSPFVTLNHFTL